MEYLGKRRAGKEKSTINTSGVFIEPSIFSGILIEHDRVSDIAFTCLIIN